MNQKITINQKLPTVVIVGRINVGKSTLFNRLTETSKAIISPIEGTTRDYNLGQVAWRKKIFNLIDSGGVNIDILQNSIVNLINEKPLQNLKPNIIEQEIIKQTKTALAKANLIIMVTDGKTGVLPEDRQLAITLKKMAKPVILVVNKIDRQSQAASTAEFFKLGLGKPWPVSAASGSQVGDFLDELVKQIKWPRGRQPNVKDQTAIKVALIGKPNVGKSSLVNKMLGEERVIVSPLAQTTREPQDTEIIFDKQHIIIIDTAGLRKKTKVHETLEKIATKKTQRMIEQADIVLLVTEANEPLAKQDAYLAGLLKDQGVGVIVVANKWDLIANKTTNTDQQVKNYYQGEFAYLSFAPLIFVSAQTGKNVDKILPLILEVNQESTKKVSPEDLEKLTTALVRHHRPAQAKGNSRPKIYGLTQSGVKPPTFTITVGPRQSLHFSYIRFIENQLRHNFGFKGIPVRIRTRSLKQ
ncbi:MAG: ribosome biogenesis GTPase Der [Patescibacteria group bacterium]|jgi:GTP-binding protein|nr:ribosome biogenesis GTPase Der [Patescibacteria group bacterium]